MQSDEAALPQSVEETNQIEQARKIENGKKLEQKSEQKCDSILFVSEITRASKKMRYWRNKFFAVKARVATYS